MTEIKKTRYSSQAYCTNCGKWKSPASLVSDTRGSLRCDQCGRKVRTKPRRQIPYHKPQRGKLETFLASMREFFADYSAEYQP